MKAQTLSIVIPTKGCVNSCKFCVSKMHNQVDENSIDEVAYEKRLRFALNNGVNTIIFTGTGEVLQNKRYLSEVIDSIERMSYFNIDQQFNNRIPSYGKLESLLFPNIELQTSGVMLTPENLYFLKNKCKVNTISLSIADLFSIENNFKIQGTPEKLRYNLSHLVKSLHKYGFNIRFSLNMTSVYDKYSPKHIFDTISRYKYVNQIIFRKLYYDKNSKSSEALWVKNNACKDSKLTEIFEYVKLNGKYLYTLPYGQKVYSYNGLSIVVDIDCMAKTPEEDKNFRYLILRENGKLYCNWDDEGSLIF